MTTVRVGREPLTYTPRGVDSFFADLARANVHNDEDAQHRLSRHQAEMSVEYRVRAAEAHRAAEARIDALRERLAVDGRELEFEYRVNPNSTDLTGGEFAPPLWLVDRFASPARAGRPLADLCDPLPLPDGVNQINIPRMTTGLGVGQQPADGAAVPSVDPVTTSAVGNVVTVAGQVDVSQQILDQSPAGFDTYAYVDLNRAYNKQLEAQLIAGTNANGQLLGLKNVSFPSGNSLDGSSASTVTLLYPLLGKARAQVCIQRQLPPEVWLMHGRRWSWIASALDSQNHPIVSPECCEGDMSMALGVGPSGTLVSLPVFEDQAIDVGATGATADPIICCKPSDMLLWEGAPRFLAAVNPSAGELQVRLSMHRYAAWIPNRYPSGIGIVTSLPQPTGF